MDNVETMAYAGAVPWHGLGEKVLDTLSPEEMAKAAGLDWEVKALPIKAKNLETGKFSIPVEGFNVITRMSDHKIFGPCGPKWRPVQNIDSLDFFKKFTEAGHMKMETAGALDGGKQVWGLANIHKTIELPGGDKIDGYLLLSNPHIWGKSMTIMFTPIRVVCQNTLMMAMNADGQRFRHPHSIDWSDEQAQKAEEALGLGALLTEQFEEFAQGLAATTVDDNVIELFVAKAMSPHAVTEVKGKFEVNRGDMGRPAQRVLELVKTSPGAQLKSAEGTLWGALNAVTYYYDHEYGKSVDSRMTSAWFGANRIKKQKAFEVANEILQLVA